MTKEIRSSKSETNQGERRMRLTIRPALVLWLLAAICFTLAATLAPRTARWSQRGQDSVLKVLLGDGRRLFANHFFVKADIYFHSGYYPSIFDQAAAPKGSRHMTSEEGGHE